MKAMVLDRISPVEHAPLKLRDVPLPEPLAHEVRVKVRCCGICRTDLHVIEGELPRQTLPVIPGHQIVGTVDALGKDCRRFQLGERVGVAWLNEACGRCPYCLRGEENLCEAPRFTGYHVQGGYAEYAVVPEDFAYSLPDIFGDEEAAPLLCAGIIGYRALKRSELRPGGTLGIFGFGSSAHVIMQLARYRGNRVLVVTRGEGHRELARRMGADWVGDTTEGIPEKLDSVILFAPSGDLVPRALEVLRPGGTLALAGIYMTQVPPLDYERHLFHERSVRSVTANTREDGRELLREAAQIPIRPQVTVYELSDANRALLDLKQDRINGSGVLRVG